MPPENRLKPTINFHFCPVFDTIDSKRIIYTVHLSNGHHVPILIHGNTLSDDLGNVIGNMAFITDMTEHKKALMLAGEVQKNLLPQDKPTVKGLDVAGRNVSCDEIGGDYYDYIWRQDPGTGPFGVVVGDSSIKETDWLMARSLPSVQMAFGRHSTFRERCLAGIDYGK